MSACAKLFSLDSNVVVLLY